MKIKKNNGEGKVVFQNMVLGQLGNHMEKKTILTPNSHHTQNQFQMHYGLKCERQNNKAFRKKRLREHLHNLGGGTDFFLLEYKMEL